MPYMQCPFCDSTEVVMLKFDKYSCRFCGREFHSSGTRDKLPSFDI